eukprot:5703-Heterococcus_DN1.PRE.1
MALHFEVTRVDSMAYETSEAELRAEGQTLAPTAARKKEFSDVVKKLNENMQTRELLITDTLLGRREGTKVTKVIKAGSLGKNTSLPHSDADIVVFVRNIRGAALDLPHSKTELLKWLASVLQEQLPQLEILSVTTHVVGMRLPVGTAEIDDADELARYVEVDLLVARDFCLGEPNPGLQACQTLQHIEYQLEEEAMQLQQIEHDGLQGSLKAAAITSLQQLYASKRADLKVCPTETQKIFVKQQPEKTNKLIRLVKKRVLQNAAPITVVTDTGTVTVNMKEHAKQQGINSYLIELLVIWAVRAEDAAHPGASLSLTQYIERLCSIVRNPVTLKAYFPPATWRRFVVVLLFVSRHAQQI